MRVLQLAIARPRLHDHGPPSILVLELLLVPHAAHRPTTTIFPDTDDGAASSDFPLSGISLSAAGDRHLVLSTHTKERWVALGGCVVIDLEDFSPEWRGSRLALKTP